MKKVACALLCIVHLLFPIARADSFPFDLTDAIVQSAFGDPRWDGYRPVLHAMHAVENGSGVVVMGNEQGNNVLCVIERRPEGWKIVIENEEIVPDAVFLDTHWLPDLFWMTDGAYYSFSLFPYRSKSGEHTLSFQKDTNGEWIVRGFSFVPGYTGIATNLGYAQFGMYEGDDLPEGKLHSYAGKSTDASGPNEIYRRVIDRAETGLSFRSG